MSTLFEAPALNPTRRYVIALLLRVRRFINRSVASMLANSERQATRAIIARGSFLR